MTFRSAPSDLQIALGVASIFAVLLASIIVKNEAKTKRVYLGWGFGTYVLVTEIGYLVTTCLASAIPTPSQALPISLWSAFIGIFGFEMLLKRLNVTVDKTGVLSIQAWTKLALAGAVSESIDREAVAIAKNALAQARILEKDPNLDALLIANSDASFRQELATSVSQYTGSPAFLKAYALATKNPHIGQAAIDPGRFRRLLEQRVVIIALTVLITLAVIFVVWLRTKPW